MVEPGIGRGRRITFIVIAAMIVGILLPVAVWILHGRVAGQAVAGLSKTKISPAERRRESGSSQTAIESTGADKALENLLSKAPGEALDNALQEKTRKEKVLAEVMDRVQSGYKAYLKKQDQVRSSMPDYASVRERVRAAAEDLLKNVDPSDTEAIIKLSDDHLQAFWDKGALTDPSAYEDGYMTRAVLEVALEKNPENFEMTVRLVEAIGVMVPITDKKLWPEVFGLLGRAKEQVLSGKVPPSDTAMLAMYDWTLANIKSGNSPTEAVSVLQWMVDNAEKVGWSREKEVLAVGLDRAKAGRAFGTNLYCSWGPMDEQRGAVEAANLSRLQSCRPPKQFRRYFIAPGEEPPKDE